MWGAEPAGPAPGSPSAVSRRPSDLPVYVADWFSPRLSSGNNSVSLCFSVSQVELHRGLEIICCLLPRDGSAASVMTGTSSADVACWQMPAPPPPDRRSMQNPEVLGPVNVFPPIESIFGRGTSNKICLKVQTLEMVQCPTARLSEVTASFDNLMSPSSLH